VDVLEILTARPGQTQEERLPAELSPHFADIEERSADALYEFVKGFAAQVRFYEARTGTIASDSDWSDFFREKLPKARDGRTPPHLALLAAFLKLYRIPRCAMNSFTARHLDFFYRRVLGFAKLPPQPDRAHLLVELKKGAAPVEINPLHAFSAGKGADGAELVFAPTSRTVINIAKVERLHSIFVDPGGDDSVRFVPEADSADGFGGELPKEEPKWPPFGVPRSEEIPRAPIGFAVASPVLRMMEGTRTVILTLHLESVPGTLTGEMLGARLECFVTGAKRWLGPYPIEAKLVAGVLTAKFTVEAGEEAIADYDPAKHEHAFATRAPVLQVLLKDDVAHGYEALRPIVVTQARIEVEASGLKSLQLEGDTGPLDPRRAFQPFGAHPVPGSRFMVGCPEALSKRLSELTLELQWLGLPDSFTTLYQDYQNKRNEADFTVRVALRDASGRDIPAEVSFPLFQPREKDTVSLGITPGSAATAPAQPQAPHAKRIHAFAAGGSAWLQHAARREWLRRPVFAFGVAAAPAVRQGFITLSLVNDFCHTEYRAKLLRNAAPAREPYTPTLRDISLSYRTVAETAQIGSGREQDFAEADLVFFHVGAFGQRREHGWLRGRFPFVDDKRVPLFPTYENEGELLIGLSGVAGGDSVSLLFKAAEGSADPEVDDPPAVNWAVLCDNYWKPLAGGDGVRDGTGGLLASGLVGVTIPTEATTLNSMLPAGLLWLKAAVRRDVGAVCSLLQVAANAIEVTRRSGGATAARLWTPLAAGKIARLKTPLAAVKAVHQPYASFGGTVLESDEALNTRAAERLRHRNRWITAWDYERAVLAAFPEVRKIKCIPHTAGHGAWLSPGQVLLVVVPDLRNRHAIDPLQPRADADTLDRIERHVRNHAPMDIGIQAKNPRYERIHLDFKVCFRPDFEFNFYSRELRRKLIEHLSPWAHDPNRGLSFGGVIYKSALLDFVEEDEAVDYVTDFRMYHLRGGPDDGMDVNEARATTPDAILVSDASHDIAPVAGAEPA
jgi:hypothetical protein